MDESKLQALSEIILPPGNTSTELQTAIDNAASGDTIVISGDMQFTDTVTIPAGKEVTIQSTTGNNWIMTNSLIDTHFNVYGDLSLNNITLDGNGSGGGVNMSDDGSRFTLNDGAIIQNCSHSGVYGWDGSKLIMNNGAAIQNCSNKNGAGVNMDRNCSFIMNGGSIINNKGTGNDPGGGVYMSDRSTFFMYEGNISGNYAYDSGGGVAIGIDSSFTMSGGIISGNKVNYHGGGIAIQGNNSTFVMMGGIINENEVTEGNGGGINLDPDCTATISGESYITKNIAPKGNGGGIYTAAADYNNLATGSETIFRCNWASTAYQPPVDAGTLYPDIQFASTSITDHPLNNFDINYNVGEPIDVCFNVTYDANGGTGSYTGPCIIPGETDTVLPSADTGISRSGYTFTGWNTEPDGSGTSYAPGDTITITCDVTLYAQWIDDPAAYTVTYGANGGSGGFIDSDRQYGTIYTILTASQADISRPGFIFTGWNTQPDGSGTSYAPGESITITGDVKLYAQWRQIPTLKRLCRTPVTKCRTSIEGQKIWVDNDNADDSRPPSVEIILLRDGKEYKRTTVDSAGDGYFGFCCLPVWKNSGHKYNYQIDEVVPNGYTKTIEGYNVINTLIP